MYVTVSISYNFIYVAHVTHTLYKSFNLDHIHSCYERLTGKNTLMSQPQDFLSSEINIVLMQRMIWSNVSVTRSQHYTLIGCNTHIFHQFWVLRLRLLLFHRFVEIEVDK